MRHPVRRRPREDLRPLRRRAPRGIVPRGRRGCSVGELVALGATMMSARAHSRGALAARGPSRLALVALAASALLAGCYASHELGADAGEGGSCRPTCTADSDCAVGTRCGDEGLCESGPACASDADCATTEVCRVPGVSDSPDCVPRCESDADCVLSGSSGPQRCEAGGCVWVGCSSDAWCTETWRMLIPTARSRCEPVPHGVPTCWLVCDIDADCANDVYPGPMRCRSGYCLFEDCTSDAQCEAWFGGFGRSRCVRP